MTQRVVVPYIGTLDSRVVNALPYDEIDFAAIAADDRNGYHNLLQDLWEQRDDRDLVIVEHDIVVNSDTLRSFDECIHAWCVAPYLGPGDLILTSSLGCTRFRSSVMRAVPEMMRKAGEFNDGLPARDWRRVDVRVASVLRRFGYTPCTRHARVRHLHYEPMAEEHA